VRGSCVDDKANLVSSSVTWLVLILHDATYSAAPSSRSFRFLGWEPAIRDAVLR